MSTPTREALVAKLFFKDEHDGTATPTFRKDLLMEWTPTEGTDSGLIALLLDLVNAGHYFEVTMVRTGHHNDGPNGHNPGGRGVDGWFLNGPTQGDWMDASSPHFADALETLAASPWRFQVGLAGTSWTPANLAAIGGQVALDTGAAFQDTGADHVHAGSVKA